MKRYRERLLAHLREIALTRGGAEPALRAAALGVPRVIFAEDTDTFQELENLTYAMVFLTDRLRRRKGQPWKGYAAALMQHSTLSEELRRVQHLGCLSPMASLTATRRMYVDLLCERLLMIKERIPGLGLGSKGTGISHHGAKLTGLEVAQSLAVLLNAGHLYQTFATERALLVRIDRNPEIGDELLAPLCPDLRVWAKAILDERQYYRFFYVVACLYATLELPADLRLTALEVLKYFAKNGGDPNDRVMWSFRKARQLAYNEMHAFLGLESAVRPRDYPSMIERLHLDKRIGLDAGDDELNKLTALLAALDEYHTRTFFTSPDAARLVVQQQREFNRWWRSEVESGILSVVDAVLHLRREIDEWPTVPETRLTSWVRFEIPAAGTSWVAESLKLLGDRSGWKTSRFLVTPFPRRNELLVDIYTDGLVPAVTASELIRYLAGLSREAWDTAKNDANERRVWRAIALVGLALLKDQLPKGFYAKVVPASANGGRIGLAMASVSSELGTMRDELGTFVDEIADEQRKRELRAMHDWLGNSPTCAGVLLAFLGSVRVVREDDESEFCELDGVVADVCSDGITWTFLEHKTGQCTGTKQLTRLGELLNGEAGAVEAVEVTNGRCYALCVLSHTDQPRSAARVGE